MINHEKGKREKEREIKNRKREIERERECVCVRERTGGGGDENRKFEILQANIWVCYYTFIKFVLDTHDDVSNPRQVKYI